MEVPDTATVAELQHKIEEQLTVPMRDQTLSLDQGLVRGRLRGGERWRRRRRRSWSTLPCRVDSPLR